MITFSIIQKSQLEGANRLDAEFYQPGYLQAKKKLLSMSHFVLGQHAFVTDGEHGSADFIDQGVKFLVAENVGEDFLNLENIRFVSEEVDKRNKRASLESLDVVLSIKGTVGMAALIFDEHLPANMNRDVSRIHIKKNIDPYFLCVFLNSKFGRGQTLRESSGNVQQMITLSRIRELIIPKLSIHVIGLAKKLFLEAYKENLKSKNYYLEAENLLLEELGLANFKPKENLSFAVNLSQVQESNRIDSDFFQPKYQELISRLKTKKPFTEIVENIAAKFKPKLEESYKYVDLGNINSLIGIIDGYDEVLGKEAPSRAKRILKPGDVIVSSVEGSLEKVALVSKDQEDYLASTGFFQLRSKEILPEVLLILAKSIVLRWQLKKHCAGTILTAVPNESLPKMFVPAISKSSQQKIADLVRKSHEARKKSKELLEEAKRKVEETIEKGGES